MIYTARRPGRSYKTGRRIAQILRPRLTHLVVGAAVALILIGLRLSIAS